MKIIVTYKPNIPSDDLVYVEEHDIYPAKGYHVQKIEVVYSE